MVTEKMALKHAIIKQLNKKALLVLKLDASKIKIAQKDGA
jgi:hypothetical protein